MPSNFAPEIRASMGDSPKGRLNKSPPRPSPKESPADVARDKQRGIAEGSPQDQKLDEMPQNQMPPPHAAGAANPAHAAMAASIAHAILGRGGA